MANRDGGAVEGVLVEAACGCCIAVALAVEGAVAPAAALPPSAFACPCPFSFCWSSGVPAADWEKETVLRRSDEEGVERAAGVAGVAEGGDSGPARDADRWSRTALADEAEPGVRARARAWDCNCACAWRIFSPSASAPAPASAAAPEGERGQDASFPALLLLLLRLLDPLRRRPLAEGVPVADGPLAEGVPVADGEGDSGPAAASDAEPERGRGGDTVRSSAARLLRAAADDEAEGEGAEGEEGAEPPMSVSVEAPLAGVAALALGVPGSTCACASVCVCVLFAMAASRCAITSWVERSTMPKPGPLPEPDEEVEEGCETVARVPALDASPGFGNPVPVPVPLPLPDSLTVEATLPRSPLRLRARSRALSAVRPPGGPESVALEDEEAAAGPSEALINGPLALALARTGVLPFLPVPVPSVR